MIKYMRSMKLYFGVIIFLFAGIYILAWIPNQINDWPINVNGVTIRKTEFYENLGYFQEKQYRQLIQKSINGNSQAFSKLVMFDCGGASYCYWHGEILAKLVNVIGEEETIQLLKNMSKRQKQSLSQLLNSGLEYGVFDRETSKGLLEHQFPLLYDALQ